MVVALDGFKIAYFPVHKAACTSTKAALYKLEKSKLSPDQSQLMGETPPPKYNATKFRSRDFKKLEKYWCFAIVRDPLEKILSAYQDKIVVRNDLAGLEDNFRTKIANRLVGLTRYDTATYRNLPTQPDLETFILNIQFYNAKFPHIYHHTRPTQYYLGNHLLRFDRIYRMDELTDMQSEISIRVGQNFTLPKHNSTRSVETSSANSLSKKAFEHAMRYLWKDYQFLKEYYPMPKRD